MKEQLIKAKAVKAQGLNEKKAPQRNNRRTKKAPAREAGAVAPPQGCRVELSGDGARDVAARDVLGLFPEASLFRYDSGVRRTVCAPAPGICSYQDVVAGVGRVCHAFELAASWCVFPASGRGRDACVALWADREVMDAPGAAELFDSAFGRDVVDGAARRHDANPNGTTLVLLEGPAPKAKLQALRSLLDALPAAVAMASGDRQQPPSAVATFDSRDDALERALDGVFFGPRGSGAYARPSGKSPRFERTRPAYAAKIVERRASPLRRARGRRRYWQSRRDFNKPALVFAPDAPPPPPPGALAEAPPLISDLPVGARLLSAMARRPSDVERPRPWERRRRRKNHRRRSSPNNSVARRCKGTETTSCGSGPTRGSRARTAASAGATRSV